MSEPKRTTIYLEPDLYRALRLRSAASERSMSEMVNEAVRVALAEDASDLEAAAERRREPALEFGAFVRDLKRRGRL
jgi:hypothetical protein